MLNRRWAAAFALAAVAVGPSVVFAPSAQAAVSAANVSLAALEEVRSEPIPYTTREVPTGTLAVGVRKVTQAGAAGTAEVRYVDGVEVSRTVVLAPVEEVVEVGTGVIKTISAPVPFATTYINTASLWSGVTKTKVAGVNGVRSLTTKDGVVIKSVIVKSPVNRVAYRGTYVPPAFLQPVGTNGSFTSPFGMRLHPIYRVWKMHNGQDIGNVCGAPVRATRAGVVTVSSYGSGGSGNWVQINHGRYGSIAKVESRYLHLTRDIVSVGQKVAQGQIIGYEGRTGASTVCHVHFEIRHNGVPIDPSRYLGAIRYYKTYNPTILPR